MNVLLTCAGRRNYLVHYFREALAGRGQVFAADCSGDAAALQDADCGFVVPPVGAPQYVDSLLGLSRQHGVRLVVPLSDLELPILARQRDRFADIGTLAAVSSPHVIDLCADKWASVSFLRECGLAVPLTFLCLADVKQALRAGEVQFPLVIKPRWGAASIGVSYAEDEDELESAYYLLGRHLPRTSLARMCAADPTRCILVQERVQGREHGLDVVNDLHGSYVTTFARRKLVMRAGETDQAVTVENEELRMAGRTIGEQLGHVGLLDCDVFIGERGCVVLEMNPRFGGGYPFSHAAGADIPACLVAWAGGEQPDPNWLCARPHVVAAKCDRLVVSRGETDLSARRVDADGQHPFVRPATATGALATRHCRSSS
jgi:carbamoyl-phosphate synthase large subunit